MNKIYKDRVSSDHSIIPFNLANKNKNSSQYFVFQFFCMHQTLRTVFFFLFSAQNGKYDKQGHQNEIINLTYIFPYCNTISHGAFLLCCHSFHTRNL